MSDKLKPCPFCGDKTEYKPFINRKCEFDGEIQKRESFNVECDNCGLATLPAAEGKSGAVRMWNTRASDTINQALVRALEEIAESEECHELWYQTIARDALKLAKAEEIRNEENI